MAPLSGTAFFPCPPLVSDPAVAAPLPGCARRRHADGAPPPLLLTRSPVGRRPRSSLPVVGRRPLPLPPPLPPPLPSTPPSTPPRMSQSQSPPLHSRRAVLAAALTTVTAMAAAATGMPHAAAAAPDSPTPAFATNTAGDSTRTTAAQKAEVSSRSSFPSSSPSLAGALKPASVPAIGVTLAVPPTWGRDTVVTTARFVSATGGRGPTAAWQNVADPRENLSVVVSPVSPGASLESIGPPAAFGRRLAATLSVPVGAAGLVRSGLGAAAPMARRAVLLMARSRGEVGGEASTTNVAGGATAATATAAVATATTATPANMAGSPDEGLYYEIEYEVITPMWRRRNVSAVCIKHDHLYTLNVQAPGERWEELAPMMRAVAASFSVQ